MTSSDNHYDGHPGTRDTMTIPYRSRELNRLQATLEQTTDPLHGTAHCVFLQGDAGSGKAGLLDVFLSSIREEKAFVCRGKFDPLESSAGEPLAAIISVINDLVQCLLKNDTTGNAKEEETLETTKATQSNQQERLIWRQRILNALGRQELRHMQELIPAIRHLVQNDRRRTSFAMRFDDEDLDTLGFVGIDRDWGLERFRLACRAILRVISQHHPVVMVLDDLQSAEKDSFEVARTLLRDFSTKGSRQRVRFLFVATHQPVPETHSLCKLINNLQKTPNLVTCLELKPLTPEQVGEWVSNLVGQTDHMQILPLVDFYFGTTKGNSVMMKQLLCHLQTQGFFQFDPSTQKYTWDPQVFEKCKELRPMDSKSLEPNSTKPGAAQASILDYSWNSQTLLKIQDLRQGERTASTERPTTALLAQLDALDEHQRLIIKTISFLGNSIFDVRTLAHILVPDEDSEDDEMQSAQYCLEPLLKLPAPQGRVLWLQKALDKLAEQGLVKKPLNSADRLRYGVHSLIRTVAYKHLVSHVQSRKELHLLLGRRLNALMGWSRENGTFVEESLLFDTVNQMNLASDLIRDQWEVMEVVEMNYNVSDLAATKHSLFSALKYLTQGIVLLGPDPWKICSVTEHESSQTSQQEQFASLLKKLANAKARMQLYCGQVEKSLQTVEQIISYCPRSGSDNLLDSNMKLAYFTKLMCLMKQNDFNAALEFNLRILEDDLKQSFPPKNLNAQLIRAIVKTRKLSRGRSDRDLINLPVADTIADPLLHDTCDFLVNLVDTGSRLGSSGKDIMFLAMLRLFNITITQGGTQVTALAFAFWGYLMAQTGVYAEAHRFGNLAIEHARRQKEAAKADVLSRNDLRATVIYHIYIEPWSRSLRECVDPLTKAVEDLWSHGAVELVLDNSLYVLQMKFFAGGFSLDDLEASASQMSELFEDYKWHANLRGTGKSFFQMISNLKGTGCHAPTVLDGAFMQESEIVEKWRTSGREDALQMYYLCVATVALFFNEINQADEMCQLLLPDAECSPDFLFPYRIFLKGCVAFLMSRTDRSRKYRKNGEAALKQLTRWTQDGIANCAHFRMILTAIRATVLNNTATGEMNNLFEAAIEQCRRGGLLQFQALACELAGSYFAEHGHRLQAGLFLTKARTCYSEWNCQSKVDHLHSLYSGVLESQSESWGRSGGNIAYNNASGNM